MSEKSSEMRNERTNAQIQHSIQIAYMYTVKYWLANF